MQVHTYLHIDKNATSETISILCAGIVISKNISKSLYGLEINLRRPWIIVSDSFNSYSQINEPFYVLNSGSIWEQYQFKSLKKIEFLGTIKGEVFQWNQNVTKSFFERRGNLENQTLIGITEAFGTTNIFEKEWKKLSSLSNIVPNTYEVTNLLEFSLNRYKFQLEKPDDFGICLEFFKNSAVHVVYFCDKRLIHLLFTEIFCTP